MNNFSNISYTNKDFNSIYVELLNYAKELSYKWDPTASNESDPGIVLLKLAAIIGDKDSYNIDKNILELMPASVTQPPAARQLFDQCGYTMRHYVAATGSVALTLKTPVGNDLTSSVTYLLPKYTLLTNTDSTVVYSTIEDAELSLNETVPVDVMEGTAVEYSINNSSVITIDNIDANNRIYITDYNVAENGIFIRNVDSSNYWQKVDNLSIQEKNKRCFKFGLTTDGSYCYIEFPEDVNLLIDGGLSITYIVTSGLTGNIKKKELKNFLSDVIVTKTYTDSRLKETGVKLTSENVDISNTLPIVGGLDPESISSAYKSYARIKNTFDTLVSTKDYTNYLITNNLISNGYVCDRTNDIQHSYKIRTTKDGGNFLSSKVTKDSTGDKDNMTAFDLCVYALKVPESVDSEKIFRESFTMTDSSVLEDIFQKSDLSDVKLIQHDLKQHDENTILLIKNKYPIKATVIPKYKLTSIEQISVSENIRKALYLALNSSQLSFGTAASYNLIYDTISNADERIKAVSLEYPTYETYVIYKHTGSYKEMRVDDESFDGGYVPCEYSDFVGEELEYYYNPHTKKIERYTGGDNVVATDYNWYKFDANLSSLWKKFRAEIFAKNILAGVTPLYDNENTFSYGVNQYDTQKISDVSSFVTETNIILKADGNNFKSSELLENEQVIFSSPNFEEESNYSSYVKFIYNLNDPGIPANTKHYLQKGEFIILFYKTSDDATNYDYRKYTHESDANVICPSFKLESYSNADEACINHFTNFNEGSGVTSDSVTINETLYTESSYIASLNSSNNVLSGKNTIKTYRQSKTTITETSKYLYWILQDDDNKLFSKDQTTRTLRSGELFMYTNSSKSILQVLGEGTVLSLTLKEGATLSNNSWTVPKIDFEEVEYHGLTYLDDPNHQWYRPLPDETLTSVEMRLQIVGPGNTITLQPTTQSTNITITNLTVKDASKLTNLSTDVSLSVKVINGYEEIESLEIRGEDIYYKPKSKDTSSKVSSEDVFILKNSDSTFSAIFNYEQPDLVIDNTNQSLYGYDVYYTDNNGTRTTLERIESTSPDDQWRAMSILSIETSSTTPQQLTSNQKIMVGNAEFSNCSILSSSPIYKSGSMGGSLVDVQQYTHQGTKKPIDLLVYNDKSTENTSDNISYNENFTAVLTHSSNATEDSYTFEFDCLPGDYILHITSDEDASNPTVTITNSGDKNTIEDLYTLNGENVSSSNTTDPARSWVYRLNVKTPRVVLEFSPQSESGSSTTYVIHPLVRYTTKTLTSLGENFEKDVLTALGKLDPTKEFDYTSAPAQPILNPLAAKSFWNSNHFYNRYTISEWQEQSNMYADDINVTTSVK